MSVCRPLVGWPPLGRPVCGGARGGWRHALRAGWRTCEPGPRSTQARAPPSQAASLCQSQSHSQPVTAAGSRTAAKGRAHRPIDRRRHHSHTCHDALLCTLRFFLFFSFSFFGLAGRSAVRRTHAFLLSSFLMAFFGGGAAPPSRPQPKTVGFGMGRERVRIDGELPSRARRKRRRGRAKGAWVRRFFRGAR